MKASVTNNKLGQKQGYPDQEHVHFPAITRLCCCSVRDRGEDLQLALWACLNLYWLQRMFPAYLCLMLSIHLYITFPLVFIGFFLFNSLGTKGKVNLFVLILHVPCPHVQSSLKIKQHDLGQLGVCHLGICHHSGNEFPILCMLMPTYS